MITYAMVPKQIAIQILSTIVMKTLNTTVIIPAKVIVVKTLIPEDVADIEDNMVNTIKAYSTKHVL
jgi:hypothetical protein